MEALIIALLIIMGFIFIVVEVFLVPGFSVPGLMGIAMIGYGIFRALAEYGGTGAFFTVLISAVAAVLLIYIALKTKTAGKVSLLYNEEDAKAVDDYSALVGLEGVAYTHLRPSGTAVFSDRRCDVVTNGVYIERDTPIRVEKIEGTRIVVSPIKTMAESGNV